MKNEKTLRKDKRAVSPVIAEILMVAIVVILAAVIAAFIFGVSKPPESPELYFSNIQFDSGDDKISAVVVGSGNVSVTSLVITYRIGGTWHGPDTLAVDDFVGTATEIGGGAVLDYIASAANPGDEIHVVIAHTPSGSSLCDVVLIAK